MAEAADLALIDERALEERFLRVGGPGGQNVNKVETAVELRYRIAGAEGLSEAAQVRLARLAGAKLTQDGVIVIVSNRFRTQGRNREDARARLAALIERALAPPPPPRKRTRPTKGSVERRLAGKARDGAIKAARRRPRFDD
jgi:ribosome-associated protein